MKKRSVTKGNKSVLPVAAAIILTLAALTGFALWRVSDADTRRQEKGLVTAIPNFDNLTTEDLPNFSDVRMVAPYKDRKIVMGYGLIIDVDDAGAIHRINAPELDCVYTAAVIGTSLYAACNDNVVWPTGGGMVRTQGTILRINLDTGAIEERIDEKTLTGHTYVNITLVAKGEELWGSGVDGVFRYNTKTKKVEYFPADKVVAGEPKSANARGCSEIGRIVLDKNTGEPVVFSQNCDLKGVYNAQAGTWDVAASVDELPSYLNLELSDFNLTLPAYNAISPIVGGKRYLFASDGVYTLVKDEFPKKLFPGQVQAAGQDNAFVDEKEMYALTIMNTWGPSMDVPTLEDGLSVYLVSLRDGTQKELVSTFVGRNKPVTVYGWTTNALSAEIQYKQEGTKVRVLDEKGTETLLVVDLENGVLESVLEKEFN